MKTKDPLIVEFCTFFLQTDDFRRYSFYPWELTALFLRFWWEKDIPRLQTHHTIQHKQSSPTFSNHHVLGCVFIFQGSWFSKMISVSHFMWHSIWHLFSWMTRWLAFHGREAKVCWCIGCFAWSSWGTPKFGCGGPKPSKCWRCFDLDVVDVFSIFFGVIFCESHQRILKFCEEKGTSDLFIALFRMLQLQHSFVQTRSQPCPTMQQCLDCHQNFWHTATVGIPGCRVP